MKIYSMIKRVAKQEKVPLDKCSERRLISDCISADYDQPLIGNIFGNKCCRCNEGSLYIDIFVAKKFVAKSYSHFFSKNINVFAIFQDRGGNSFLLQQISFQKRERQVLIDRINSPEKISQSPLM